MSDLIKLNRVGKEEPILSRRITFSGDLIKSDSISINAVSLDINLF